MGNVEVAYTKVSYVRKQTLACAFKVQGQERNFEDMCNCTR